MQSILHLTKLPHSTNFEITIKHAVRSTTLFMEWCGMTTLHAFFDDKGGNNNLDYSMGITWLVRFKSTKGGFIDERIIVGRSHFGDLSWLHGMGSARDQ